MSNLEKAIELGSKELEELKARDPEAYELEITRLRTLAEKKMIEYLRRKDRVDKSK